MLTTISQYLKQRIEALNYIQQVYGIGQILQVNGEQIPSVNVNGEQVHVNFDNHSSLVFFLKNGNVGHSAEEHQFLANADLITKTYPLRLILYSQALENTDCNSLSQSLADNIISALNGEQAAFKESVSVDRCRIDFGNTDLDKYSVWESLYSIDSVLKDTDVLIAIEFTVTITGLESCFIDSPCETPEFTFDLDGQTFCEKVDECLGISPTGSTTEYLNRQGEWTTPAGEPGTVSLVDGNGTTFDTDHYDLGGEITEDTTLSFNPTQFSLIIGDISAPSVLAFGNLNNDGDARFIVTGVSDATISGDGITLNNNDPTGSVDVYSAGEISIDAGGTTDILITPIDIVANVNKPITPVIGDIFGQIGSTQEGNQWMFTRKEQTWDAGFYNLVVGDVPHAQLFYGELDSDNNITDITRIEATPTQAHMRHIYNTGMGGYNGIHVNATYSQVEYGKSSEDGQDSGICLTVNATGVHHYESGLVVNSFDNFGNFTIGDPTDDDSWRLYRDNDSNLLVQVRVSGTWTTINQFNKP